MMLRSLHEAQLVYVKLPSLCSDNKLSYNHHAPSACADTTLLDIKGHAEALALA
jgi:hypothetical protein